MSELATQLAAALPQDSGPGPEWVKALRNTGAEQFRAHGLPTRKDEAWKYTGLGLLDQREVQLALVTETPASDSLHPAPLVEAGFQVNILDGRVLGLSGELPTGLTILPLADALDIAKATIWSSIGLTLFLVFVYRLEGVPRSVLILDAGITFGMLSGIRFANRIVRELYPM